MMMGSAVPRTSWFSPGALLSHRTAPPPRGVAAAPSHLPLPAAARPSAATPHCRARLSAAAAAMAGVCKRARGNRSVGQRGLQLPAPHNNCEAPSRPLATRISAERAACPLSRRRCARRGGGRLAAAVRLELVAASMFIRCHAAWRSTRHMCGSSASLRTKQAGAGADAQRRRECGAWGAHCTHPRQCKPLDCSLYSMPAEHGVN